MIEVISPSDKDNVQPKINPMQDIEEAFKACKFGRFHLKLLCVVFLGTIAGVLTTNTTPFILPAAECDLGMDLVQKGLLNAAPFIGMSVTSLIAGFLTDNFGRKLFLKVGFGGMFVFCIVAGSSQTFEMLVASQFFQGIFFATSISANVTFVSEFCHKSIRDRVMLCQASFISIAQIIAPAIAWVMLTQDWVWSAFDGYFVLQAWNFYLYAMSLWSLSAYIIYSTLPESPKYLVAKQKYDEARDILINMYKENTGMPARSYPYVDIWKDIVVKEASEQPNKTAKHQLVMGLLNVKQLFHKPLVFYLIMLGFMAYLVLAIYSIIRLWFPQLSTITEHYQLDSDNDLCIMLDKYTSDLKGLKRNTTVTNACVPIKSGAETYTNSMIIGLVCFMSFFITGALVNKVGKKRLQVVAGILGAVTTLGLRWANSKVAVVALFAIDTAILQLMKCLNQAMVVEYFPTTIRSFALGCTMMMSRFGTLTGNIGFPILLDIGCVIPFFTMAGTLLVVTAITMSMPKE